MVLVVASRHASTMSTRSFENIVHIDNVVWRPATVNVNVYTDGYFKVALERALALLSTHCLLNYDRLIARMAPMEFKELGPDVLMQTNVQFLLKDDVWVPMSLAVQRETNVYELSALLQASKYDFKITVNTDIDLMTDAHICAHPDGSNGVASDSATSTLLHELLHGLGIYSLVSNEIGGGFNGAISTYDTLLKFESNNKLVFPNYQSVQNITGSYLKHYDISVANQSVFNPSSRFVEGKSLSHLLGEGVMQTGNTAQHCLVAIDDASIDVLNAIGWECMHADRGNTPTIIPGACNLVSECVCILDMMCKDCDTSSRIDNIVFISLILLVSMCLHLVSFIVYKTCMMYEPAKSSSSPCRSRVPLINNF